AVVGLLALVGELVLTMAENKRLTSENNALKVENQKLAAQRDALQVQLAPPVTGVQSSPEKRALLRNAADPRQASARPQPATNPPARPWGATQPTTRPKGDLLPGGGTRQPAVARPSSSNDLLPRHR